MLGSFYCNSCEVLDTTTSNASFQPLAERPVEQTFPVICVAKTDVYLLAGNGLTKMVESIPLPWIHGP